MSEKSGIVNDRFTFSAKNFATLFGIGFLKPGPGTWASLATLPLAAVLMYAGPFVHMFAIVLLLVVSIFICDRYETQTGQHDDSTIVIDEVVGQLIALVWLPLTWQSLLAGFVFFRVLDILKPFPISWVDQKIRGGTGVVADDVLAGIIASVLLQVIVDKTTWLGVL